MNKIILIMLLLSLCSSCVSTVSSKNEIGKFNVNVSFSEKYNTDVASISGISQDSALWINSYKINYKNDKVILIIKKGLRETGISGPYLIEFPISKSVNEIYLDSEVIWKR